MDLTRLSHFECGQKKSAAGKRRFRLGSLTAFSSSERSEKSEGKECSGCRFGHLARA